MVGWNKHYDYQHLYDILIGDEGATEWFNAHTLRYLNKVWGKADTINFRKLLTAFPQQCIALAFYYDWKQEEIVNFVGRLTDTDTFNELMELIEEYEA